MLFDIRLIGTSDALRLFGLLALPIWIAGCSQEQSDENARGNVHAEVQVALADETLCPPAAKKRDGQDYEIANTYDVLKTEVLAADMRTGFVYASGYHAGILQLDPFQNSAKQIYRWNAPFSQLFIGPNEGPLLGTDQGLHLVDIAGQGDTKSLPNLQLSAVTASASANTIAAFDNSNFEVRFFDFQLNPLPIKTIKVSRRAIDIVAMTLSRDASHLVLSAVGAVRVFDISGAEARQVAELPVPQGNVVESLAFSPEGTRLAMGMANAVQIVSAGDWETVCAVNSEVGALNGVEFSAQGARLLVTSPKSVQVLSSYDLSVLWTLDSQEPQRAVFGSGGDVVVSTFSNGVKVFVPK